MFNKNLLTNQKLLIEWSIKIELSMNIYWKFNSFSLNCQQKLNFQWIFI